MNIKAEMGHYSSVVGNSVHLTAEDGRMIGQVAILCHTDDLRGKDVQEAICKTICDAINASSISPNASPMPQRREESREEYNMCVHGLREEDLP